MGQKRKLTDHAHKSSIPFKKYKPSNAKTGFKGRTKWVADTSFVEKSAEGPKSVEVAEESSKKPKSFKKKKMDAMKIKEQTTEKDWSKVVRKISKRKQTRLGAGVFTLEEGSPKGRVTETEKPLSRKSIPPATSAVIAKHRNRVKKRKKTPENRKLPGPVKCIPTKATQTAKETKEKSVLTERTEKVSSSEEKMGRIHLPDKPDEVSSNWKQLQATLPKPSANAVRPKPKSHSHFQRDRRKAEAKEEEKEPEIWFDDVDEILIDSLRMKAHIQTSKQKDPLVKQDAFKGLTKVVAMDCEMVGVGAEGKDSMLARVSIVNQFGQCIYDKFLQPREQVTDYRTHVSGIRPADLEKGEEFSKVQKEVHDIMKGRMLVGHALHNDLKVLFLDHPRKKIRDTARYKPFRKLFGGANPSLKKLCDKVLGVKVQEGEHNSVQDAQAAMRLYTMYKKQWEKDIKTMTKGVPKTFLNKNKTSSTSSGTVSQ